MKPRPLLAVCSTLASTELHPLLSLASCAILEHVAEIADKEGRGQGGNKYCGLPKETPVLRGFSNAVGTYEIREGEGGRLGKAKKAKRAKKAVMRSGSVKDPIPPPCRCSFYIARLRGSHLLT